MIRRAKFQGSTLINREPYGWPEYGTEVAHPLGYSDGCTRNKQFLAGHGENETSWKFEIHVPLSVVFLEKDGGYCTSYIDIWGTIPSVAQLLLLSSAQPHPPHRLDLSPLSRQLVFVRWLLGDGVFGLAISRIVALGSYQQYRSGRTDRNIECFRPELAFALCAHSNLHSTSNR